MLQELEEQEYATDFAKKTKNNKKIIYIEQQIIF